MLIQAKDPDTEYNIIMMMVLPGQIKHFITVLPPNLLKKKSNFSSPAQFVYPFLLANLNFCLLTKVVSQD